MWYYELRSWKILWSLSEQGKSSGLGYHCTTENLNIVHRWHFLYHKQFFPSVVSPWSTATLFYKLFNLEKHLSFCHKDARQWTWRQTYVNFICLELALPTSRTVRNRFLLLINSMTQCVCYSSPKDLKDFSSILFLRHFSWCALDSKPVFLKNE